MMILRRRWEYWVCAVALCKLGATIIPATLQLTSKDIAYRANSAQVKMGRLRGRRLRVRPDGPCAARFALHRAPRRGGGGGVRVGRRSTRSSRTSGGVRAPGGRGGGHQQRHHAHLLHVRHHGACESRVPQLRASAGAHPHGALLAAGARERAAHERDRQRLGGSSAGARSTANGSAGPPCSPTTWTSSCP